MSKKHHISKSSKPTPRKSISPEKAKKHSPVDPYSLYDYFDLLVVLIIIGHVVLNPFTKVEETLLTNGMYDHLYLGTNFTDYDH